MRILQRIGRSIANTSKLQPKYYLLTTTLGWVVVAIGTPLILFLMYKSSLAFGLPAEFASLEGRHLQFLGWIGVTLISIPATFYACMIVVAGAFGLIMALRGKFTMSEATAYAFFGEYPQYWYRQDAYNRDDKVMEIRPYSEPDEAAVIELWHRCELTRPWNDPRKDILRKLTTQPELFLVGELGGTIIATIMAGFDGHRGWVNYLAVAPEHRKGGLGRLLMRHVEACLEARGCPKLNIQVRTTNKAVLEFYRRIGYVTDDVVSLGKRLIHDAPPA